VYFEPSPIAGCYSVRAKVFGDSRGRLAKSYVAAEFEQRGLRTDWGEDLHSISSRGVIRGMHFQTPPEAQAKLVFCIAGEVVDVILDLRRGSPSFGRHHAFHLDPAGGAGVYVPTGCAHGFAALGETNLLFYKLTGGFSAEHDGGVALDSFGFDWPIPDPVLSERDRGLPAMADFVTPFTFDPARPSQ
jgi:dTDP-4-dehydrorhamnose 3,5-epimerase